MFGEQNYVISMWRQVFDVARVADSQDCYERERIKWDNTKLRTQLERVLNEINSAKTQKENHQTSSDTAFSQSNEAAEVTVYHQSRDKPRKAPIFMCSLKPRCSTCVAILGEI